MSLTASALPADDEFSLTEFFRTIWRSRYLVVISTALAAALAITISLIITPLYRAEVVISEVRDPSMGGSAIANQLGGLASLAGLNLGAVADAGDESLAVLQSRQLVEEFITRNNLMPHLYAEAQEVPSLWFAVKRFRERTLSVKEDSRSNLILVAVKWKDAKLATDWANGIVALANEVIRTRVIEDATRNVKYLEGQIARTNVVELKQVMYNLVQAEMKTLMLANARKEYAFKTIDPAVVPEIRFSPRRTLMAIFGTLLGFCIGVAIALVRRVAALQSAERR